MPARAFWSGALTFGLISVPVELLAAVRSRHQSLRMLDREGRPLQRRYYCSREDRPLAADEIKRGYEVDKDQFVVVEDEELEALEPGKSREIDLRRFVSRAEIDPLFLDRPYILAPAGQSTKAYHLLAAVMERSGRAGVATFVMRDKEYLAAIFAEAGLLRLVTLRFAEEVRTPDQLGLPEARSVDGAAARNLEKVIRTLEQPQLDLEKLQDVDSEQILALAERKRQESRDLVELAEVPPDDEAEPGEVIDLMQLLKQRVEGGSKSRSRSGPASQRRTASRRPAAAGRAQRGGKRRG